MVIWKMVRISFLLKIDSRQRKMIVDLIVRSDEHPNLATCQAVASYPSLSEVLGEAFEMLLFDLVYAVLFCWFVY